MQREADGLGLALTQTEPEGSPRPLMDAEMAETPQRKTTTTPPWRSRALTTEDDGGQPSAPTTATTTQEVRSPRKRRRSRSPSSTAGVQLCSRLAVRFAIFFELFAGAAALSAAVQALAPAAHVIRAADAWRDADQDLLQDEFLHYCATTARQSFWLHQAPPCRTFTRSRRSDKWGTVRQLRSDEKPEGFGSPETEQANELARRAAYLSRCVMESGGYFSIENPYDSRIWDMPFMKALLKLEGVRFVRWDACMSGSLHKKPTGFLTNAPWIVDVVCDRATRPHNHVPLEGLVTDYRPGAVEDTVWYTSLAAEYSEGMCNKLAKDFRIVYEHTASQG